MLQRRRWSTFVREYLGKVDPSLLLHEHAFPFVPSFKQFANVIVKEDFDVNGFNDDIV